MVLRFRLKNDRFILKKKLLADEEHKFKEKPFGKQGYWLFSFFCFLGFFFSFFDCTFPGIAWPPNQSCSLL